MISEPDRDTNRRVLLLCVAAAIVAAAVAISGWYQFSLRAGEPIDLVRKHRIPGTETTIGEGILDYLKDQGVRVVSDGFRPSWGAEEGSGGAWTVSYVYEVGRRARWVSWRVYTAPGRVVPLDGTARRLWEGAGRLLR